jgi:signal transduction histidine kinase
MIYRQEVRAFTDKEVALLQNFAAQAVIAMENARLINETREALEQQTATAEVLQVINSSPGNLVPVFDAILDKAHALCGATFGSLQTYDGEFFRTVASRGLPDTFLELLREPFQPGLNSFEERLVRGDDLVHIPDVTPLGPLPDDPLSRTAVETAGLRTLLLLPLRKEAVLVGYVASARSEVRPFSDKQIALLQNFAAQAVIAMENARLLGDLRDRTNDLQQSLIYQTATSDVLQAISRSAFDLKPILDALVETAARLCGADLGLLSIREGGGFRVDATFATSAEYEAVIRGRLLPGDRGSMAGRAALGREVVQVADLAADRDFTVNETVSVGKLRTALSVPLLRNGEAIGAISFGRARIEPFTERQTDLIRTFADQAVIAMENARLIAETRAARDDAETALRDLRTAQANLIQAEKMASLGQLTAGIAHEIKNPLNFVNNFASLSVELLDELKETAAPLDEDKRADFDDTMETLTGNLEKITEHGKRADNIVKSMLEHSRGVSGERREVDLNNLVDEALNLAYHGARAQNQSFNITLEHNYAPSLRPIEVAPQEMTRVLLNLFANGFYAAHKRNGEAAFRPVLKVTTADLGEAVEIKVRDNGTGIPPDIKDKLFQPFFTTKPTGEGTGLGLSISYDIITQQHGGTITVDSEPGAFTEFTIHLPRSHQPARAA